MRFATTSPGHQSVTVTIRVQLWLVALRHCGFADREIVTDRTVWRSRLGSSFSGPSRSHRSRKLLTTFWREIKFPLRFLRGGSLCACRFCLRFCCCVAVLFASGGCFSGHFLPRFCGISFHEGPKFHFQFGKFLRPFQQPSLETTNLFFEGLKLHNAMRLACLHRQMQGGFRA